jgi:exopolysaccharide biosynthesis protein
MESLSRFFVKPCRWAAIYGTALALFFAFVLLDTFVIPRAQTRAVTEAPVRPPPAPSAESSPPNPSEAQERDAQASAPPAPAAPVITASSYEDENIQITVETLREYDTTFYVADIRLSDAALLKTALARDTFGRNIKDTTSGMAEEHNAIFAVNGDYYGFRDTGWMLRNGVLYRGTSNDADALVVGTDGNFSVVDENSADAASFLDAWQIFSFGPALVEGGEITVDENSEISGRSSNSNPRTAIGQAGELHYIVIVSDGRTDGNAGLSLYQLALEFKERGCSVAYNLDGGGSSTMVLNGEVLNDPVGGRRSNGSERKVSDIVYIGYE